MWVYCLKTLNKLLICPLGNTPSAPSDESVVSPQFSEGHIVPKIGSKGGHVIGGSRVDNPVFRGTKIGEEWDLRFGIGVVYDIQ